MFTVFTIDKFAEVALGTGVLVAELFAVLESGCADDTDAIFAYIPVGKTV